MDQKVNLQNRTATSTSGNSIHRHSKVPAIITHNFRKACSIDPYKFPNTGIIQMLIPGAPKKALNRYGNGPFCKFRINMDITAPGVYAILENEKVKYIGQTMNLTNRFNGSGGYGSISDANRYKPKGQATNCRINNKILMSCLMNNCITLWFFPIAEFEIKAKQTTLEEEKELNKKGLKRKKIEDTLISAICPVWNCTCF